MNDDRSAKREVHGGGVRGFFSTLFLGIFRDLVKLVVAFVVGTGGGAIVCWFYGFPLGFSILGGILVLAFALALTTDSFFS